MNLRIHNDANTFIIEISIKRISIKKVLNVAETKVFSRILYALNLFLKYLIN